MGWFYGICINKNIRLEDHPIFATRFTTSKVSCSSPFCLMGPLPFHGLSFYGSKKWRSDPIRSPFTTTSTDWEPSPISSSTPDLAAGKLVRSDLKYHRVPHRSGLGRVDGFAAEADFFFREAKKNWHIGDVRFVFLYLKLRVEKPRNCEAFWMMNVTKPFKRIPHKKGGDNSPQASFKKKKVVVVSSRVFE